MDLVLEALDSFLLDKAYATILPAATNTNTNTNATSPIESIKQYEYTFFPPGEYVDKSAWSRDHMGRQAISLFLMAVFFAYLVYFLTGILSYAFVYDKRNFQHPKMLKNQMWLEIKQASTAIPIMTIFTVPWFVAEVRGHSFLYWDVNDYSLWYLALQFPLYIMFTDMCIYFIHRWLHWPGVYKRLHKPHHKWIVPTPFASFAFHPMDGYLQSVPYHLFPFVFPLHKFSYLVLFAFVTIWTVMIHDGEYLANNPVINGSACHTIHHLYFNYNYGQYTTLWDRLGRSHRTPDQELFDKNTKMDQRTWKKQSKQMEEIAAVVEDGVDDREYIQADDKKTK